MVKSSCCSDKPQKEETCVFANYTTKVGGVQMVFCCEGSAKKYLNGKSKAKTVAKKAKKPAKKGRKK